MTEESAPYENCIELLDSSKQQKQKSPLEDFIDNPEAQKKYSEIWKDHWHEMPEFKNDENKPFKSVYVHFRNEEDYKQFAQTVKQNLTLKTKSIWYPKLEMHRNSLYLWTDENNE